MKSDLFLGAGEASADLHAARVLAELRRHRPELTSFGIGGEEVRAQGTELVVAAKDLSLFGLTNLFSQAPRIWRSYQKVLKEIEARSPKVALLLDMPDLNLRLAEHLKARGTKIVYYISPQVWAWRRYRVNKIKRLVDKMLVVIPFEEEFYRDHDMAAEFVGHPLLETLSARTEYRPHSEVLAAPRIALLPGSRPSELHHHIPILNEVVKNLKQRFPSAEFRLPVPSTLSLDAVTAQAEPTILSQAGGATEILAWADIALVASGTATLETALIGTPSTLFYESSKWNGWIYHNFIRYEGFIGLPNLLLGEEAVREFSQGQASVENLTGEALRLIEDDSYRRRQTDKLALCRANLGTHGASQKVAERILSYL